MYILMSKWSRKVNMKWLSTLCLSVCLFLYAVLPVHALAQGFEKDSEKLASLEKLTTAPKRHALPDQQIRYTASAFAALVTFCTKLGFVVKRNDFHGVVVAYPYMFYF